MSSSEFTEWKAYTEREPWGYEMDNFRAFTTSAVVANVAPRKRGARALKPQDFYPETKKPVLMTPRQKAELKKRRKK